MPSLTSPTTVDFLEAERDRRTRVGQVRRLRGARLVTNPRFRSTSNANQVLIGATEPPVEWEEIRAEAEPALRALGIRTRRVMLFGDEVRSRLSGTLSAEGFHERLLWLMSFRGLVTASPRPEVAIRLVDPFLRPAWFTLSYRVAQERGDDARDAAERVSLYSRTADEPSRRIFAGFIGDTLAGSADLGRIGSLGSIEHVQTAPEWRGQGVATALILRATEEAIRDGRRGVQLTTHSQSLADQLYRPCGFESISFVSIFERSHAD